MIKKSLLSVRFFCLLLIMSLSHITFAQGQMCWPVETCVVTNVSQGGESKTCWFRTECTNFPTGVTQSSSNPFSNSIPTPQGGSSATTAIEKEVKQRWCTEQKERVRESVAQCRQSAHADYAYNLGAVCQGQTSITTTGSVSAWIFGGTVSITTSCSLLEQAKRDATISRCVSDGKQVANALEKQCKGV